MATQIKTRHNGRTKLDNLLTPRMIDFGSVSIFFVLIFVIVPMTRHNFNPDAVSYYRLAVYWGQGDVARAVSGWWGPLSSWIMALLRLGVSDPALVGRLATAVGGLVFLSGALALYRVFTLPLKGYTLVAASTAVFAALWVGGPVTPDLLLGGLLLWGIAALLRALASGALRHAGFSGVMFGLSYLAKTPGLVLSLGLLIAIGTITLIFDKDNRKLAWRTLLGSFASLSAIALPWIIVLSLHYEKLTWTTAAGRAQLVTAGLYLPNFRVFHHPREGRITSWEEPSELEFRDEITLGLVDYARIFNTNINWIGENLSSFDLFRLLPGLAIAAFFIHQNPRPAFIREPWRLGALLVAVLAAPYLVSFANQVRFFLACYPLLLGAAAGLIGSYERQQMLHWGPFARPGMQLLPGVVLWFGLAVSISYPFQNNLRQLLQIDVEMTTYSVGRRVAARLEEGGLLGPIAEVGNLHHLTLYVALAANVRWYGAQLNVENLDAVVKVGPRLLFVEDGNPIIDLLRRDPRFVDRSKDFSSRDLRAVGAGVAIYEIALPESNL